MRVRSDKKNIGYSRGGLVAEKVFAKWSVSWKGPLVYTHLAWIVILLWYAVTFLLKTRDIQRIDISLHCLYYYRFLQFRSIAPRESFAGDRDRQINYQFSRLVRSRFIRSFVKRSENRIYAISHVEIIFSPSGLGRRRTSCFTLFPRDAYDSS